MYKQPNNKMQSFRLSDIDRDNIKKIKDLIKSNNFIDISDAQAVKIALDYYVKNNK